MENVWWDLDVRAWSGLVGDTFFSLYLGESWFLGFSGKMDIMVSWVVVISAVTSAYTLIIL